MNAEIKNVEQSTMGTIKFDLKAKGHRGFQNFICYPAQDDATSIKIQSEKRIGSYYPKTGKIELSKSRSGGSYFVHLSFDKLTEVQLSGVDNQHLKMQIFTTASKEVGKKENGVVSSDNSGAINIFDL